MESLNGQAISVYCEKGMEKMKGIKKRDRTFDIATGIISGILLLIVLYPLYFVIIASISNPDLTYAGKIYFLPKEITWEGYKTILEDTRIYVGYYNTILYTIAGTLLSLILTLTSGYALSVRQFMGKKIINFLIIFTMIFSGGLVPTYLLMQQLHLVNTIWGVVIPGCVGVWNLVVTRTFFEENIPVELFESAQLDGCGHFRFFLYIVLPLSGVIIAVIALFYGVNQWNGFFNALVYLNDKNKFPLQLFLRDILLQQEMMSMDPDLVNAMRHKADLVKYAMIIVASAPVLAVYPFLQRFFVKGGMIGSVKG